MKRLLMIAGLVTSLYFTEAQDTFSIVAIDTVTGEIGSAGASCIDDNDIPGGAIIISDVIPGRGAIHTQSYWNATNQQNAHNRMMEGMSPQEIIDWLVANDAQNNPGRRQYGVVDLDPEGHPRSAGFTGATCLDYKNHIAGPNYCIQGNILLGQQILDSIEARFLNTEGSFPEKMMAALQGANVPGADTRCMSNGTSSLSAFIRIARPDDLIGSFYCDLNVPSLPEGMEPIDSLQTLFDAWFGTTVGMPEMHIEPEVTVYPNPASDHLKVVSRQSSVVSQYFGGIAEKPDKIDIWIINTLGQIVFKMTFSVTGSWERDIDVSDLPKGIYNIEIISTSNAPVVKQLIKD